MSIANAAHCSMMGGGGAKYKTTSSMRSYNNTITDGGFGFIASNLGSMPMGVTLTAWFRYATYPPETLSKSVFKYGDRNNGIGYGTWKASNSLWYERAGLVEGKYWLCYGSQQRTIPTDYTWHHAALIVKSGSSPLYNACYVDGVLQVPQSGSGTTAMYSPSGAFSVCGRDNGTAWESGKTDIRVTRVCIFGSQMSESDIMADYLAGMSMPKNTSLTHYWDATVENNKVIDKVGNWNLTFSTGCSISDDTPWTT